LVVLVIHADHQLIVLPRHRETAMCAEPRPELVELGHVNLRNANLAVHGARLVRSWKGGGMSDAPKLLGIKDLDERLPHNKSTIYRLCKSGELYRAISAKELGSSGFPR
jgi:hypothetical protein